MLNIFALRSKISNNIHSWMKEILIEPAVCGNGKGQFSTGDFEYQIVLTASLENMGSFWRPIYIL